MKYIYSALILICITMFYTPTISAQSDSTKHLKKQQNLKMLEEGDFAFMKEDYEAALYNLQPIAEYFDDSYLYYKIGICLFHSKNKDLEAIQYFSKSLRCNSESEFKAKSVYHSIGLNEKTGEKVVIYSEVRAYVFSQYPRDNYFFRSRAKFSVEDYSGAVLDMKIYHRLEKDSTQFSTYIIGVSLGKTEKWAEACVSFP